MIIYYHYNIVIVQITITWVLHYFYFIIIRPRYNFTAIALRRNTIMGRYGYNDFILYLFTSNLLIMLL